MLAKARMKVTQARPNRCAALNAYLILPFYCPRATSYLSTSEASDDVNLVETCLLWAHTRQRGVTAKGAIVTDSLGAQSSAALILFPRQLHLCRGPMRILGMALGV